MTIWCPTRNPFVLWIPYNSTLFCDQKRWDFTQNYEKYKNDKWNNPSAFICFVCSFWVALWLWNPNTSTLEREIRDKLSGNMFPLFCSHIVWGVCRADLILMSSQNVRQCYRIATLPFFPLYEILVARNFQSSENAFFQNSMKKWGKWTIIGNLQKSFESKCIYLGYDRISLDKILIDREKIRSILEPIFVPTFPKWCPRICT